MKKNHTPPLPPKTQKEEKKGTLSARLGLPIGWKGKKNPPQPPPPKET
jgi:hypothetical protein